MCDEPYDEIVVAGDGHARGGTMSGEAQWHSDQAIGERALREDAERCRKCRAGKSIPGGKDFCPKCKPRRKPRMRSRTTVTLVNSERKKDRG